MIKERKVGLDFLRSFAIIFVVYSHYTGDLSFLPTWLLKIQNLGWTGVDLFFVISGFLISSQWFSALKSKEVKKEFKIFFIKRAFRILPSYFLILTIYFFISHFVQGRETVIWPYLLFIQNYTGLFLFTPSWSLCVEEHFYLIFPFFSYVLIKKMNRYKWIIFLLFFVSPILRFLSTRLMDPSFFVAANLSELENIFYYPTHMRLDGLAIGILLAYIKEYSKPRWDYLLKVRTPLCLIGLVILSLSYYNLMFYRFDRFAWVFGCSGLALGFGLLFPFALELKVKRTSWVSSFSELSFSMYLLFHLVGYGMTIIILKSGIKLNGISTLILYSTLLWGASFVMFKYFEGFFMKKRRVVLEAL